jgi:hypothetical protein
MSLTDQQKKQFLRILGSIIICSITLLALTYFDATDFTKRGAIAGFVGATIAGMIADLWKSKKSL